MTKATAVNVNSAYVNPDNLVLDRKSDSDTGWLCVKDGAFGL